MNIRLNGETRHLEDVRNVAELIAELGLDGRRLAVEHNGEIVPGGEREARSLADGDRVEIVHAIGGGSKE